MILKSKKWLDRSDPLFEFGVSPEIDADNLNIYDNNINTLHKSLDNLSTAYGNTTTIISQDVLLASSDLAFAIDIDSTDTNIFTYDDLNHTITFKKPGTFNFRTRTEYVSNTSNSILVTTEIVDSVVGTVWQSDTLNLSIGTGRTKTITNSKPLVFIAADLPKTLKVIFRADGEGITINNSDYTLNTLASGATASGDHSDLTGTDDNDCHPISAITNLNTILVGIALTGEVI